jgi:hypothetical protein
MRSFALVYLRSLLTDIGIGVRDDLFTYLYYTRGSLLDRSSRYLAYFRSRFWLLC